MAALEGNRQVEAGRGKSATAFRTIAEVASDLDVPAHVLRFWESKFPQIKPLKRRGGRRYYRPEDVVLLRRIRTLLYTEGYTIRGAQKLLREAGGKDTQPPPAVAADFAANLAVAETEDHGGENLTTDSLADILAELEAIRGLLRSRDQ